MAKLRVRNPMARSLQNRVEPAPRVRELNGKRIGLYWNLKAGGEQALKRVEILLRERFPDARFAYYQGDVGAAYRYFTSPVADRIARECDAIIGTTGD